MVGRSALVIIDVINEIAHSDGKFPEVCLDYVQKAGVIPKVREAVSRARNAELLVIWVTLEFDGDYSNVPSYSRVFEEVSDRGALRAGSWGASIVDELDPFPSELILSKSTISPFRSTELESALRDFQVNDVFLCGITTDMAILSTSRDCHDLGFSCTVLEDACGARDMKTHENALKCIGVCASISSLSEFNP